VLDLADAVFEKRAVDDVFLRAVLGQVLDLFLLKTVKTDHLRALVETSLRSALVRKGEWNR
jgi:hypothetical protein